MSKTREIKRSVFGELDGWSAVRSTFHDYLNDGRAIMSHGWEVFDDTGKKVGQYAIETKELMFRGKEIMKAPGDLTMKSTVAFLWLLDRQERIREDKFGETETLFNSDMD
jgi:hypothetical protein